MSERDKNKMEVVPFHAAKLEHFSPPMPDGLRVELSSNRDVTVWPRVKGDGYLVDIRTPTLDGKMSLLRFGLYHDAAKALLGLLYKAICHTVELPDLTYDEAEKLWPETEYALEATHQDENSINGPDATAFFLEGYLYAQKLALERTVPE